MKASSQFVSLQSTPRSRAEQQAIKNSLIIAAKTFSGHRGWNENSTAELFGSECNQIHLGPKGQRQWGRKLSKQTGASLCCRPQGWVGFTSHAQGGCRGAMEVMCSPGRLCCHLTQHHRQLLLSWCWMHSREREGFGSWERGRVWGQQEPSAYRGADPQKLILCKKNISVYSVGL